MEDLELPADLGLDTAATAAAAAGGPFVAPTPGECIIEGFFSELKTGWRSCRGMRDVALSLPLLEPGGVLSLGPSP